VAFAWQKRCEEAARCNSKTLTVESQMVEVRLSQTARMNAATQAAVDLEISEAPTQLLRFA